MIISITPLKNAAKFDKRGIEFARATGEAAGKCG
jgi:hypothetical protein